MVGDPVTFCIQGCISVSFLLLPTSSGAMERFFSMAGTVTYAQPTLSGNLQCMCFMAQLNGNIEERLV